MPCVPALGVCVLVRAAAAAHAPRTRRPRGALSGTRRTRPGRPAGGARCVRRGQAQAAYARRARRPPGALSGAGAHAAHPPRAPSRRGALLCATRAGAGACKARGGAGRVRARARRPDGGPAHVERRARRRLRARRGGAGSGVGRRRCKNWVEGSRGITPLGRGIMGRDHGTLAAPSAGRPGPVQRTVLPGGHNTAGATGWCKKKRIKGTNRPKKRQF